MTIEDSDNVIQDTSGMGSTPELSDKTLESSNRTVNSVGQAFSICERLINDWKKGILNAARITSKINGERPYNQKRLKDAQKDWKTNISTGFLATECRKVLPRLHMPVKTAKYLTAASLPSSWANGSEKSDFFRQTVTETIRSWPKFNFYLRGLAREVGIFGFGHNVWFDEWEWRPTLVRMDKGFIPQGTEVMDTDPTFFACRYDYHPSELVSLLRDATDSGRKEWKKDNVVQAVIGAMPPVVDATYRNARSYEDLVRQATWGWRYEKGSKVIRTYHLFSKEVTGKVSHYILLADGYTSGGAVAETSLGGITGEKYLLYENLDEFDSMSDVVTTMVFDFGDGTVHGSWGVGQILYDLAAQVEKIRCDSVDNMRMTNRMKLQVPDAKNVNDVKLTVNDTMMIVSGAQFAGNQAAMPQDIQGYELLDQKLTQIAQQKIGAFVPPIPLQPSDVKAAQINAAMSKEKELQEDVLENWLIQFAVVVKTISRRLAKKGSPDEVAKKFRQTLLKKLTEEEIDLLVNVFPVQSVIDFTEYKAQQRALFAASVKGDPLFRQAQIARVMAAGAGDERFVNDITVPEGDQSDQTKAARDQLVENASIALGQPTPVVSYDNDWVHMQTMKPGMDLLLKSGNVKTATIALRHYASHYAQGVAKKVIPQEEINSEKSYVAAVEKQIQALQQREQIQQQGQAAQQQATTQAQQMVASGQA
jgi:hypothetical protein